MQMDIVYGADVNAWTITFREVELRTSTDVALWQRALDGLLESNLHRQRAYLLLDMGDFVLNRKLADEYQKAAKTIKNKYAFGMVPYGRRDLGQLPDRRTALAALEALRQL
ncbi:MAG TPA: hypothetical protein VFF06_10260 [Polyangia bacterium]|nr:hypothetical protein [Polyangia bacterium]